MKVTHITECWVGGLSTYMKSLIEYQLESNEFEEISLIYSSNRTTVNLQDFFTKNKKLKLYSYNSSRNPLKFYSIAKEINSHVQHIKPDIIHLHSTFAGVYGRIIKNKIPGKIVYCAHGWAFTQKIGLIKQYIYAKIEKYLARNTNAIINISRYESEKASSFNVSCPINVTILNGVNDTCKSLDNLKIKNDHNKINIGFIGRLDYQKGFDLIEPFFRELISNDIHLYVIGEPEREDKILYAECTNITYLGWIDNQKIDQKSILT